MTFIPAGLNWTTGWVNMSQDTTTEANGVYANMLSRAGGLVGINSSVTYTFPGPIAIRFVPSTGLGATNSRGGSYIAVPPPGNTSTFAINPTLTADTVV